MVLSVTVLRSSRRLLALLAAVVLCTGVVFASAPVPAGAQSLIEPAQTKQQAAAAEKAADEASGKNDGGSLPLVVWLGGAAIVVIGIAAYFIGRDARVTAGPSDPRRAAKRPIDNTSVRGAPKTMFSGEAAPGGQTKRSKNRAKAKRAKASRRANR
ncbi:MAG: hypothetical protein AAGC46_16795 [Solirubrobacteraceae bacterium]|nr:hypothetical protein [Patulibacter sp.]